jgi:hypothetical protein
MSYRLTTFSDLEEEYGIQQSTQAIFAADIPPVAASDWLLQTLAIARRMPLRSEKAKSELLIAPIVTAVKLNNEDTIQVFSGEVLRVDKRLNGEIDFIFARYPRAVELRSPIFCVTEAKRGALEEGFAQCAAQLYGARVFNETHKTTIKTLYGAVSNGTDWKFLKLANNTVFIDENIYTIEQLPTLLGIFQEIIRQAI